MLAMIKKKAKAKAATKKAATKKKGAPKSKKEINPAEVRKEIAEMVGSEATSMAQAVIGEGKKGQLATVKYLFEVAEIYPPSTDGNQATKDEECLAKTLLDRLNIPDKPIALDEEEEPMKRANPSSGTTTGKTAGEKESNEQQGEHEGSESQAGMDGEHSKDVSALV